MIFRRFQRHIMGFRERFRTVSEESQKRLKWVPRNFLGQFKGITDFKGVWRHFRGRIWSFRVVLWGLQVSRVRFQEPHNFLRPNLTSLASKTFVMFSFIIFVPKRLRVLQGTFQWDYGSFKGVSKYFRGDSENSRGFQ